MELLAKYLWLLRRHFLPNILPVIIVTVTFQVTWAIFGEAFLSYIGLGIQPPQTSWGKLVAAEITAATRANLIFKGILRLFVLPQLVEAVGTIHAVG